MTVRRPICKVEGCTEKVKRVRLRTKDGGPTIVDDDVYCVFHRWQNTHEIIRGVASRSSKLLKERSDA